jgi:hypothetical protein
MKHLGVAAWYAYGLRIVVAIVAGVAVSLLPEGVFGQQTLGERAINAEYFADVWAMLGHSLYGAVVLALKIIVLITVLIVLMEWIKALPILQRSAQHVSKGFTLASGLILGITYGAGVLISEARSGHMSRTEIFVIATFLLICHAIIEDTLLFVMFGASGWVIVVARSFAAIIVTWIAWILVSKKVGKERTEG